MQLMKNDCDKVPLCINANMIIQCCQWNYAGTYFAVAGSMPQDGDFRGAVQFYNNLGQYIRKFWQQGTDASIDFSWEGSGLNMCISIGSTIFFANVKPHYKWGWIQGCVLSQARWCSATRRATAWRAAWSSGTRARTSAT
jgi:WD repeat-containing protein 35